MLFYQADENNRAVEDIVVALASQYEGEDYPEGSSSSEAFMEPLVGGGGNHHIAGASTAAAETNKSKEPSEPLRVQCAKALVGISIISIPTGILIFLIMTFWSLEPVKIH